jgi:hypothetical protein
MADGRQRKKVRIANEAGSHQIGGRPVANIPEAKEISSEVYCVILQVLRKKALGSKGRILWFR